jgi:hypothetical protein
VHTVDKFCRHWYTLCTLSTKFVVTDINFAYCRQILSSQILSTKFVVTDVNFAYCRQILSSQILSTKFVVNATEWRTSPSQNYNLDNFQNTNANYTKILLHSLRTLAIICTIYLVFKLNFRKDIYRAKLYFSIINNIHGSSPNPHILVNSLPISLILLSKHF